MASSSRPPGKTLISATALQRRVAVLGREIAAHYGREPFVVLGLMNGSLFFLVDLLRRLPAETRVECWRVQSYAGRASSGKLQGLAHCGGDFAGRRVLIVDDILDTGLTLDAVTRRAKELGAKKIDLCVLLRKRRRRTVAVRARWAGFDIADRFVVGYGLDLDGQYRALKSIQALD